MKDRIDIKNFIVGLERQFPVNSWTINEIHLWPFLRMRLYFYLVNLLEAPQETGNATAPVTSSLPPPFLKKAVISVKAKVKNAISIFNYFRWLRALPSREYLFVGFDGHRVNYKGKRYNKFFDVFIEKYKIKPESAFFECGPEPIGIQYHDDIIFKYHDALKGFLQLQKISGNPQNNYSWEGYDAFLEALSANSQTRHFATLVSKEKMAQWSADFPTKILFFKNVLEVIRPEKLLVLCYYSYPEVLALVAAANQLNIQTIEMQHGPQTEIHLCYGSWSAVPDDGYDILPRNYWCWDAYSKSVLEQWTKTNALYHVTVTGNPWIDYWKTQQAEYPHKDFILYSLQPSPVTIPQLFPEALVSQIRQSPSQWFLRLHPRQLDEKKHIIRFLNEKGIFNMVNIDDATNDPLPQLLANARLHVTHFSGSAIEAALFNVFTVLLNEIAITSFPDLIAEEKAKFLDVNDPEFAADFQAILKKEGLRPQNAIFAAETKGDHLFGHA